MRGPTCQHQGHAAPQGWGDQGSYTSHSDLGVPAPQASVDVLLIRGSRVGGGQIPAAKLVLRCHNRVNLRKGLTNFIQVLQPSILGQALLIFRQGTSYVPSHELADKRRSFRMPGRYHFKYGAPWKCRPTRTRNREIVHDKVRKLNNCERASR